MKFADTSYLLALLNPDDELHDSATALSAALNEVVVTTMWVLTELGRTAPRTESGNIRSLSRHVGRARGFRSRAGIAGIVSARCRVIPRAAG